MSAIKLIDHMIIRHDLMPDNQTEFTLKEYREARAARAARMATNGSVFPL